MLVARNSWFSNIGSSIIHTFLVYFPAIHRGYSDIAARLPGKSLVFGVVTLHPSLIAASLMRNSCEERWMRWKWKWNSNNSWSTESGERLLPQKKLNGWLNGWLGAWGSQPKIVSMECGVLPIFPSGPFKRFAFMGKKCLRTFLRKLCLAEAHFFWLLWANLVALAKHARMCHARYVLLERLGQGVGICMDCWYSCVFT